MTPLAHTRVRSLCTSRHNPPIKSSNSTSHFIPPPRCPSRGTVSPFLYPVVIRSISSWRTQRGSCRYLVLLESSKAYFQGPTNPPLKSQTVTVRSIHPPPLTAIHPEIQEFIHQTSRNFAKVHHILFDQRRLCCDLVRLLGSPAALPGSLTPRLIRSYSFNRGWKGVGDWSQI